MGNIPLAGCSFHFLGPRWNSAAQRSGRKCQCSEANLLNESLPENWPHSSLSLLISRQHASFPSYGIWREFSEKDVPGGEKLTQCAERSLVAFPRRRPEGSQFSQFMLSSWSLPVDRRAHPCSDVTSHCTRAKC